MNGQLQDRAEEIKRLERCINDLVSVLALPAAWSGGDPSQIVPSLLDALLRLLRLDLVYARLEGPDGERPLRFVRIAQMQNAMAGFKEICDLLDGWFRGDPQAWSSPVWKPIGDRDLSLVPVRLGLQGELGLIVAGSEQADFPNQTEKLVLNAAANQAVMGLQEARLLSQQKRLASEHGERASQRTRQLAEAEAQVLRSEERWRSVFENSAIGVALTDLKGRFIAANPVYQKLLGYTEEELQQIGFLDITVEQDRDHNWMLVEELLAGTRRQFQIEKQYRRKNGSLVWVRNSVSLVPGSERVPRFLMALSEDITERKQAEEALRRSEAFLAEAQSLSSTGSFFWRVATDEITWSEQLYRIYEFEIGQPVTLDLIRTRVHPKDLTLYENMVKQARNGAKDFEWQYRLLMPDHSIKYMHAVAHASRDQYGQLEYIAAIQDVTARRLSEEALEKTRSELAHVARVTSLGTLTASIAHELNQPLSGIITNASTCLRMLGADPPNVDGARETARRTIRDGNRAADVVTRLRTLYSKKDFSPELIDLNEAVQEVIALSLNDLQRHRVVMKQKLAEDLPPITGDRVQLQQVILNLLRNASDAMNNIDDRPRELLIRTEREGNRVRLSVKDAGVGFEPHAADKLFEAFYTTKTGGMGIGLSISRSIIEAHHGRLWATANDDHGATFSFAIPCRLEGLAEVETRGNRTDRVPDAA